MNTDAPACGGRNGNTEIATRALAPVGAKAARNDTLESGRNERPYNIPLSLSPDRATMRGTDGRRGADGAITTVGCC